MDIFGGGSGNSGSERRVGKISLVVSAGRYRVTDDLDRIFPAEASVRYKLGDRVHVLGEIIIGLAGKAQEVKVYEV